MGAPVNPNIDFTVYQIKNLVNGKRYIGITSDMPTRTNYHFSKHNKSNFYLHRSIRKYGKDSFRITVIDKASCWKDVCDKEIYWIEKLDTFNNGMNLTKGGDGVVGFHHSEKTKIKIANSEKGKFVSDETRTKISLCKIGNKNRLGTKHTQATKDKISKTKTGVKMSQEAKNNMSKARIGITHSDVAKGNMSKAAKKRRYSKDVKRKMSLYRRTLSDAQIKEIKKLLGNGEVQHKIGKLFNINQGLVSNINTNKVYEEII